MPQIRPNVETFARIRVIGIGGSGQNAVDHMIDAQIEGVEYVCINTDTQHLDRSRAQKKIHIGKNLTKGVGAGMNPEVGEKSAEETKADIQEALKDADMVFVACGMGGGTGTGASPVVARLAREQGILTIGVVTRPFSFEGDRRSDIARQGIEALQKEVDALIVISNDRLLAVTDRNTSFKEAFAMCDNVLLDAVKSIADIISERQTVNIDFADVKVVLSNAGSAYVGIGLASGEDRATQAAHQAINSSLLDVSIAGAKGVILAIATAPDDLGIFEVNTIAKMVNESIDPNARFIFGPVEDPKMKKGDIKVTILATGFDPRHQYPAQHSAQPPHPIPTPISQPAPEILPTVAEKAEALVIEPVEPAQTILQADTKLPNRFIPEIIATNPIEPRFTPPKPIISPVPDKPAFSTTMPSDSIMQTFQPESVNNAPEPLEVLDDSAPDDDWNTRFPAFIRRNK